MKTTALRFIAVLMLAVFLIPACGPADKPDAPPPVSETTGDVLPEEPLPTSVPTVVPAPRKANRSSMIKTCWS